MENKINIAELLKDCPSGMELYSPLVGDCKFVKVHDHEARIIVKLETGATVSFQTDGRYYDYPNAECILFPSKDQRDWSKFQRPFMDGDIVVCTNRACTFTAIFKGMRDGSSFYRYGVMYDNVFRCLVNDWSDFNDSCRLATEEEKAKLFDAIKSNGYKWNPETKTLEKVIQPKFKVGDEIKYKNGKNIDGVEQGVILSIAEQDDWELAPRKFDITTLKPFESRVLVRDNKLQKWCPAIWGYYDFDSQDYKYKLIGGNIARYCIPYEKNEHLLGKTDDCDEFYKNW